MTAEQTHFDLIVIGSGTAGSSAWYAARQLGRSVAVFEPDVLGGECPTFACVPTKALLHCAEVYETAKTASRFGIDVTGLSFDYARVKAWKDEVVSSTGAALGEQPYREMDVHLVRAAARFVATGAVEADGRRYTAERFLIATGAGQRMPPIEGIEQAGYITFRQAIDLTVLPRSLFILGGGAVGCEFAHLFNRFGTDVTIADRNERLLHAEDPEVGDLLADLFAHRGIDIRMSTTVLRAQRDGGQKRLTLERDGRQETLLVDEVLIATGKSPNVGLGLEAAGIEYDKDKGVTVDSTLRTTNPAVYAAGDVAGPYRFTHAASYQGYLACQNMFATDQRHVDYAAMPRCVFTSPEVAAVGLTEAQARAGGRDVRVGLTGIDASDRALTSGEMDGFVKVIADASGRLLGGAALAPHAGEFMQELALAIKLGATAEQLATTIHAFPTFSEALAAACAEV
jgi:pyruvate/2-oxoglutarate dehydrogenase complex dihydrolipoamide dehydrogenase (E3) component